MKPFDQWTPATFQDVAGQNEAVTSVERVLALRGGPGGTAWYITGDSGTGKGCLSGILAGMMGQVWKVSVAELTPAKVRELVDDTRQCNLLGSHAVVVDECHGLRQDTMRELKTALETGEIPASVVWLFTTTTTEQGKLYASDRKEDAAAFVSRCIAVELANDPASQRERAFAVRKRAVEAGIDGYPEDAYLRAMTRLKGNTRALAGAVLTGRIAALASTADWSAVAAPKPVTKAGSLDDLRAKCVAKGMGAGYAAHLDAVKLTAYLERRGGVK